MRIHGDPMCRAQDTPADDDISGGTTGPWRLQDALETRKLRADIRRIQRRDCGGGYGSPHYIEDPDANGAWANVVRAYEG